MLGSGLGECEPYKQTQDSSPLIDAFAEVVFDFWGAILGFSSDYDCFES